MSPNAAHQLDGRRRARGRNGTLMPTTPATRSGASSASCHTTIEPQSCPTKTACSSPMSSRSAEEIVGEVHDVVVLDGVGPARLAVPRWSGASTWYPRRRAQGPGAATSTTAPETRARGRRESAPGSTTWRSTPFVPKVRSRTVVSVMEGRSAATSGCESTCSRARAGCSRRVVRVDTRALARCGACRNHATVVLVEGASDKNQVRTLARRRGRDLEQEGVDVVAMGGATNIATFLERFGPHGLDLSVAGLCDVREEESSGADSNEGGWAEHTDRDDMEALGYHASRPRPRGRVIRALGPAAVEEIIVREGELGMWTTFRRSSPPDTVDQSTRSCTASSAPRAAARSGTAACSSTRSTSPRTRAPRPTARLPLTSSSTKPEQRPRSQLPRSGPCTPVRRRRTAAWAEGRAVVAGPVAAREP